MNFLHWFGFRLSSITQDMIFAITDTDLSISENRNTMIQRLETKDMKRGDEREWWGFPRNIKNQSPKPEWIEGGG